MKKILTIFLLIGFTSVLQSQSETKQTTKSTEKTPPSTTVTKGKFVDKNGDGINDNLKNQPTSQQPNLGGIKKPNDVFIDEDGDGICDRRANGMGFGQKGMGKMKGKKFGKGINN
jgi:hypothetical protein